MAIEQARSAAGYRFQPGMLAQRYKVAAEHFGCVTVRLPDDRSYVVDDLHYTLADGRRGMEIVPVSDEGPVPRTDGSWAGGSALVDERLRARMRLGEGDPIFALVGYIRPEEHQAALHELATTTKLFFGYKHLASYLGDGKTTHAPENHQTQVWLERGQNVWNVRAYPATLFFVSLDHVDQVVLNRNARIVDALLNVGVMAPANFERLCCRVFDLNTSLQFYRDWIRRASYLSDLSWWMTCSDHKAIVLNVMLNVPHSREDFAEIFGTDGEALWNDFRQRFAEAFGREFTAGDETHFEPLWKKEGLGASEIRPLSLTEYSMFDAARVESRLEPFTGPRPLPPGVGLGWPTETVIDLVGGFISTYVSFSDAGGICSAAALLRLADQAPRRLHIADRAYCEIVQPFVAKLLLADALVNADSETWLATAKERFANTLTAPPAGSCFHDWTSDRLHALVDHCFREVETRLPELNRCGARTASEAANWLEREMHDALAAFARSPTGKELGQRFFTTPAVLHRIALGLHTASRYLTVVPVCTVVDQSELECVPCPEEADCADDSAAATSVSRTNSATAEATRVYDEPPRHELEAALTMAEEIPADILGDPPPGTDSPAPNGDDGETGNPLRKLLANPEALSAVLRSLLAAPPSQAPDLANTLSRAATEATASSPAVAGAVAPSACACGCGRAPELAYALGRIGYDFDSLASQDKFAQEMALAGAGQNPFDGASMLAFLAAHETYMAALYWTLSVAGVPCYAIRPAGPFASAVYQRLLAAFALQQGNPTQRIAAPGVVRGQVTLLNGQQLPVIEPDLRGLRASAGEGQADAIQQLLPPLLANVWSVAAVRGLLGRLEIEAENTGRTSPERALNYVCTTLLDDLSLCDALGERTALDTVRATKSQHQRPRSECWDVTLAFFDPGPAFHSVQQMVRFTVDVSQVVPVLVGTRRSWMARVR